MREQDFSKPAGFEDHDPDSCRLRRTIERTLLELFERSGYREIVVPTAEYEELYHRDRIGEDLYRKLLVADIAETVAFPAEPPGPGPEKAGAARIEATSDRVTQQALALGGDPPRRDTIRTRQVVLRPDLTAPVARYFATRLLRGEPTDRPLRVACAGQVFRNLSPAPLVWKEFRQVGLELIGARGRFADLEVLGLACDGARALGLGNWRVRLGHSALYRELIKGVSGRSDEKALGIVTHEIEELSRPLDSSEEVISRRDRICADWATRWQLGEQQIAGLLAIASLGGPLDEFVAAVRRFPLSPEGERSLDEVQWLATRIAADFGAEVIMTPSTSRGIGYYTGMTFAIQADAPSVGFINVAGGGRYDQLHSAIFARAVETCRCRNPEAPLPAGEEAARFAGVGLAFGVDSLEAALGANREKQLAAQRESPRVQLAFGEGAFPAALALSRALRERGAVVEWAISDGDSMASRFEFRVDLGDGNPASARLRFGPASDSLLPLGEVTAAVYRLWQLARSQSGEERR